MKPADQDLENRRPVWQALSNFFLDTELQPNQLEHIARILSKSPYEISELEEILYREVYPVCIPNMNPFIIAGEWEGFDEEGLEEAILKHTNRRWALSNYIQLGRWMIRDDWNQVKERYAASTDSVA